MVQKSGKHGIRTGNTLRAMNTKHFRKYRHEACIIWRSRSMVSTSRREELYDFLPGGNLPYENVPYSMNKEQRWLLPEMIKNEIKLNKHFAHWRFAGQIELVERHKLCKNSNCISIHTSTVRDDNQKVLQKELTIKKQRGYCDADNVLKTFPLYSKHTRRQVFLDQYDTASDVSSDPILDATADVNDQFEAKTIDKVRLEVFCPCAPTSILSLKPKAFGYDYKKYLKCTNIRRPSRTEGNSFRNSFIRNRRQNAMRLTEEYVTQKVKYEEFRHQHLEREENEESKEVKRSPILLFHFILQAFKQRNIKISDKDLSVTFNGQTHVESNKDTFVEHTDYTTEYGVHPVQQKPVQELLQDTDKLQTVEEEQTEMVKSSDTCMALLFQVEEVTRESLSEMFRNEYLECRCLPRRFLIDISKFVNDLDGIGNALRLIRKRKTTFCWLSFDLVRNHQLNTASAQVYNVSLKVYMNNEPVTLKLDGIVEHSLVHISSVVDNSLLYVKTHLMDGLLYEQSQARSTKVMCSQGRSLLEEINQWNSSTYLTDLTSIVKYQIESARKQVDLVPFESTDKYCQSTFCAICCCHYHEVLGISNCYHLFCVNCWKMYLQEKLRSNDGPILCPERLCNTIVDTGTLMALCNVKEIISFFVRNHNNLVKTNPLNAWCTNEDCGRVIEANEKGSKVVRCYCGESRCLACLGSSHWPLSCHTYRIYVKKLIDTRDRDIVPHDFIMKYDCKYCRVCYKILKRYDACFIDRCDCGSILCQRCSLLYHSSENKLYEEANSVDTTIENTVKEESKDEIKDNNTDVKRTNWYKLAIKHRQQHHPYRMAKLHACAKLMANRLSHYILKEERKCHFIYLEFETGGKYFSESDKAGKYLEHTVNMYRDVSYYLECTFILMDYMKSETELSKTLHRQVMALSTCAKNIFDLCKDGALTNSKIILSRVSTTRSEVYRLMHEIIDLIRKLP